MRIAILGAGAIGSLIGGLLVRAGNDVLLVGRGDHVRKIRERGLVLESPVETLRVQVPSAERLEGAHDLILLATKMHDLPAAARDVAALGGNAPVVTLQNGIRADDMAAEVLEPGRIVGCVVQAWATYLEPGKVEYNVGGQVTIGYPFHEPDDALSALAATLSPALPVNITSNIAGARWTKLILNLINALPAATGVPAQELLQLDEMCILTLLMRKEGVAVAAKAGIVFAPIPGASGRFHQVDLEPSKESARSVREKFMAGAGTRPALLSTLQSLKRGRPTEIDYLNGEIVRVAQSLGMAAPYNRLVVELIHRVERTGEFTPPGELWEMAQGIRIN